MSNRIACCCHTILMCIMSFSWLKLLPKLFLIVILNVTPEDQKGSGMINSILTFNIALAGLNFNISLQILKNKTHEMRKQPVAVETVQNSSFLLIIQYKHFNLRENLIGRQKVGRKNYFIAEDRVIGNKFFVL